LGQPPTIGVIPRYIPGNFIPRLEKLT